MNKLHAQNVVIEWLNLLYAKLDKLNIKQELPTKITISYEMYASLMHHCKNGNLKKGTYTSRPAANNYDRTLFIYGMEAFPSREVIKGGYQLEGKHHLQKGENWYKKKKATAKASA